MDDRGANPTSASRSLAPKEHGAYGQLGVPLATALAMATPEIASILLTIAAGSAFVAHEPVLVALGRRGPRARRVDGPRALRLLTSLGAAAIITGGAGLALAPPAARLASLVPLGLGAVLALFISRDQERTTLGEILAAAALTSAALPVALSSGVAPSLAWGAWVAWTLSFSAATWAVRAVIRHAKGGLSLLRRASPLALPVIAALGLERASVVSLASMASTAPMLVFSLALALSPPRPAALRRVGFGLVGASLLSGAMLVAGARC